MRSSLQSDFSFLLYILDNYYLTYIISCLCWTPEGLERVKEISRILRVHSEIEALALTYYKQAYEHESFIRVSLQKKEVLAGCCVLVSCRQFNWPITLGTIGFLLNADQMVVGGVYQEMVKILSIKAPIVNITDVMEGHCQE